MSAPLTAEEEARYTEIIDSILAEADLQTVTRKLIRQGLQDATQTDLSGQRNAIKSLIEARFDAISEQDAIPTPPEAADAPGDGLPHAKTNGYAHPPSPSHDIKDEDDDMKDEDEIKVSLPPPKKPKREKSTEDADARFAAELQAQEDRLAQGRSTRGGGAGKPVKKAKAAARKRKTEKRVDGSDNSGDAEDGTKKRRKAGGGLNKPFNLSVEMQELTGEAQLSRPQVVKKIWDHIKANDLQDPSNKREILCDEKMQAVFRTNKVNMFKMNKHIGSHLYEVEADA